MRIAGNNFIVIGASELRVVQRAELKASIEGYESSLNTMTDIYQKIWNDLVSYADGYKWS